MPEAVKQAQKEHEAAKKANEANADDKVADQSNTTDADKATEAEAKA